MVSPRHGAPVFLFLALIVVAAEPTHAADDGANQPPHHAAVFVGATRASGDTSTTVGVDYEYRFYSLLGAGPFYEAVFANNTHHIVGVAAFLHPVKPFKVIAGPAVEFSHGHSTWLFRTGVGYELHVGSFAVTPTVAVDFVSGGDTAVVYGATIGLGF